MSVVLTKENGTNNIRNNRMDNSNLTNRIFVRMGCEGYKNMKTIKELEAYTEYKILRVRRNPNCDEDGKSFELTELYL